VDNNPQQSVTHGQFDARPTVTSPAAGHHRPLTGTKLYCLVTEAHACEQLAQGCYLKARGRESNPRPSESQVQRPNHYATKPHRTVICYMISAETSRVKCLSVRDADVKRKMNPLVMLSEHYLHRTSAAASAVLKMITFLSCYAATGVNSLNPGQC